MLRLWRRLRALFLIRRSADFVFGIKAMVLVSSIRARHGTETAAIVNGEPANCRVVFKTGILCSFQNRTDLHGTIGEKKDGEFFWIRSGGQHRVVARGVEAEDDSRLGRFFDAESLSADRHAAISAYFEQRADAPDIGPPGTTWHRAQNGAIFLFGAVPC